MNVPRALFAAAAAIVTLTGCDIPTELPKIEQRWIIPVDEIALSVAELLPDGVTLVGNEFQVSAEPLYASENLGTLCAPCDILDGQTGTVPSFSGTISSSQTLPAGLVSAIVTTGSMRIQISNQFGFDPLLNGGSMVIVLEDEGTGRTLGGVTLEDATDDIPAYGSVMRMISVSPGTITGPIRTSIFLIAPGGQTGYIDNSALVEVIATTEALRVSEATVNVGTRAVALDERTLDLDLDENIVERILQGTIVLEVENPFPVTFNGTLQIGTTSKTFSVTTTGASTVPIPYTGSELRSFIGRTNVLVRGPGTVTGGTMTVRPREQMDMKAKLDFTLEIG